MESLTKNKVSMETITRMVEKYFAPLRMESCKELTEGFFNMAYEIGFGNGRKVILKIAPARETRVMTYEKNIMASEVHAMKMAKAAGDIPVPKVFGFDAGGRICGSPYFFMEKLDGRSLNAQKSTLPSQQLESIYMEVGRINQKINRISCRCFGYPGQPEFQGNSWYPVFRKMLKAGIQDAEIGNVDLQIPVNELWDKLERDKAVFEEVKEPKLVHWDCWDGNIFVRDGKVTGIIDWERSLWADPLMEVGFRTYSDNALFQKGYGIDRLTDDQQRRALWYDIYLLILVALECEYRKYETMDLYHWSVKMLGEQFEKLR